MAGLLVVIFVLVLVFALLPNHLSEISKKLTQLLLEESTEDQDLRKQLQQLFTELKTIHMVDEFAKYAKTERKINKLKDELTKSSKTRNAFLLKIKSIVYVLYHVLRGLCFLSIILLHRYKPVLQLPEDWLFPGGYILSLPIGISGHLSVLMWLLVCRNIVNTCLELAR